MAIYRWNGRRRRCDVSATEAFHSECGLVFRSKSVGRWEFARSIQSDVRSEKHSADNKNHIRTKLIGDSRRHGLIWRSLVKWPRKLIVSYRFNVYLMSLN